SIFEWAAHELAKIYQSNHCLRSAAHWFETALARLRVRNTGTTNDRLGHLFNLRALGEVYLDLNLVDKALRCYRDLFTIFPDDPTEADDLFALARPALCELQFGDPERGERYMRIIRARTPKSTLDYQFFHIQIRLAEGMHFLRYGQPEKAISLA